MPAGSYQVADWVALDCMRLLENMLAMAGFANFGYQDEFKKEYAIGESLRVKFPQEFLVTDGFEYNPQAINRQASTITIDQPMQVAFEWDSLEQALKLERTQKQIQAEYNYPAMQQLASEVEMRFMDFAFFNTNNVVGTLAATPTSWDVYAQADQRMTENAGDNGTMNNRQALGVTPGMMRTMIANSLTQFNPQNIISKAFQSGYLGSTSQAVANANWYKSMYCHPHTTGVWTTVLTGVTVSGAGQSGATLNVACSTGDTFKRGDIVAVAGMNNVNPRTKRSTGALKNLKIMADATGVASAAALTVSPAIIGPGSPYQNVSALPVAGNALALWPGTTMVDSTAKTGICGQLLNKMAFAMAGVDLMLPSEGGTVKLARKHRDDNTGLTLAMLSMFDGILRRQINRMDMLIGFGPLYTDRAACLIASLT